MPGAEASQAFIASLRVIFWCTIEPIVMTPCCCNCLGICCHQFNDAGGAREAD